MLDNYINCVGTGHGFGPSFGSRRNRGDGIGFGCDQGYGYAGDGFGHGEIDEDMFVVLNFCRQTFEYKILIL